MNNKIQRLTVKMVDLFPDGPFESPQACFDLFKNIWSQQYDYFSNFDSSFLLKLIINIYSYKNTGNFKLADSLLNKLGFASLFITQGNIFQEECSWCDGNGDYHCTSCEGDGSVNCNTCDGDGETECYECDGEGVTHQHGEPEECETCQGSGKDTCGNCGGSGTDECVKCEGSGNESCDECGGEGVVDTDEKIFDYYVIATWNKFIKDRCELNEGTMEPALDEYDFDRLRDDYIIIGQDESHKEFRRAVQTNEVYCTTYTDEPKLFANHSATLWMWVDDDGIDKYTL